MPKHEVYFELVFREQFTFETEEGEDVRRKADEYLYDCWYNLIDRPEDMEITHIEENI